MRVHEKLVKLANAIRPYVELVVAVVAVISLYVAIKAYKSTNEFEAIMIKNLENLNRLSEDTQDKLSELPKNLDRLNTAVKDMSENAKVQGRIIRNNLAVMEKSVIDFSKTISAYDKELKSITETADKQLALIREQQRKIEEEAKRSPDLFFDIKNISKTSEGKISLYPGVINKGNKIAKDVVLYVDFPEEVNITTSMTKAVEARYRGYVQYTLPLDIVHAPSPVATSGKYTRQATVIDLTKNPKDKIILYYYIDEPQKSYSGSLTIDTASLRIMQGERRVDIK